MPAAIPLCALCVLCGDISACLHGLETEFAHPVHVPNRKRFRRILLQDRIQRGCSGPKRTSCIRAASDHRWRVGNRWKTSFATVGSARSLECARPLAPWIDGSHTLTHTRRDRAPCLSRRGSRRWRLPASSTPRVRRSVEAGGLVVAPLERQETAAAAGTRVHPTLLKPTVTVGDRKSR